MRPASVIVKPLIGGRNYALVVHRTASVPDRDRAGRQPRKGPDMGNEPAKTLRDDDIATRHRRTGPTGASGAGTDADSHSHTDSDTAAPAASTSASTDADTASDQDRSGA